MAAESAGHRPPVRISPKTRVYRGSRSWIRWDAVRRQPSTGAVRLRARCSIHAPYGCGWIPAMVTRRVLSSITKKTRYRLRPASVSTSTVNRSQAARPSQCACKNAFHGVRRARSGAGSIPWSCRIRLTVFRAMSWPRFASAPRMRVYPHGGFSTAIRTTRSATSRGVIGRPRRRRALPSYFRAISLRYQRRIVSGVTMLATCARIRRPSFWPRTASRRRWASVRRSGRGPRCSRRTRFSSRR